MSRSILTLSSIASGEGVEEEEGSTRAGVTDPETDGEMPRISATAVDDFEASCLERRKRARCLIDCMYIEELFIELL